ncbi:MAG: ion transporter [Campylobacterota bacterium]|nr:ion transporter [Campylobacterota bacterium]
MQYISKLLISFAFYLERSEKYQAYKKLCYNIVENSDYPLKRYFDLVMIFLILTSVGILIYDIKHDISPWLFYYEIYVVTFIFLIEYLLRLWVYSDFHAILIKHYKQAKFLNQPFRLKPPLVEFFKGKLEYIFSLSAIIDLLAIIPTYRPLRVLRIFMLFRVFKLLRYFHSMNEFIKVLIYKKFEFITLILLLLFILFVSSVAIYIFEGTHNPKIDNFFDAIYWSLVTISTVGFGDITPVTTEGKLIAMVVILSGIAWVTFITSVTVSLFSQKLQELKDNRVVSNINKKESFLILCGYGNMSKTFLTHHGHHQEYIIIDKDPHRVDEAVRDGYSAIHDDVSRYEVISKFNTHQSNITLITLTKSDIENIYITLNAKVVSSQIKVIARCNDNAMATKYTLAHCDHILLPNHIATTMLTTAIKHPNTYPSIYNVLTGNAKSLLDEIRIDKQSKLLNKSVQEIPFKEHKLLFLGVLKASSDNFIFNPAKELIFLEDDILLVMGYSISIENFKNIYSQQE